MVPRLGEQFDGTQAGDRHSARPQRRYSLEARARGIEGRKTVKPYVRITREKPQAPRAWRPDVRSALGGAIGGAVAAYFVATRSEVERGGTWQSEPVRVPVGEGDPEVNPSVRSWRGRPFGAPASGLRDARVPKGRISVNAERGAVFLRGEVASPDLIEELERAARRIGGVRSVENLLHQPGTPAPHSRGGALLHRKETAEHGEAG
jgi:hypothetical protein